MNHRTTSEKLGRAVHLSLLSGLLVSGALLILGTTLAIKSHASQPKGGPGSVETIVSQAVHGNGIAILNLGIFVLMLTPILRVMVLGVGWLLEREWRFAAIAFIVLALLATSVVLGTG
jgi:uncharacterized membrane protein